MLGLQLDSSRVVYNESQAGHTDHDPVGTGAHCGAAELRQAAGRSAQAAIHDQDKPFLQPRSHVSLPGLKPHSGYMTTAQKRRIQGVTDTRWGLGEKSKCRVPGAPRFAHLRLSPLRNFCPNHSRTLTSAPLTQQPPLPVPPKNPASFPAAWTSRGTL